MSHIPPLVPLSEFLPKRVTHSYLATPLTGLPWQSRQQAQEEYIQIVVRGTEVFSGYPGIKADIRKLASLLIDGCEPNEVSFSANATSALNMLLGCIKMEHLRWWDNIVIPSDAYSTLPLATSRLARMKGWHLPMQARLRLSGPTTEQIIAAINRRTRLVIIDACHYVSGEMREMEKIAAAAHRVGARIILDVSQVAGVIPLNLSHFDALFGTAVKWLNSGSNGIAICWVNRRRWPNITPENVGWNSAQPFDLPFTGEYKLREDGQRLEPGGVPWEMIFVLRDALRNLTSLYNELGNGDLRLGQMKVTEHVRALGDEIIATLDALGLGLTILSPHDTQRRGGYVSVKMADEKAREVCKRLNKRGIYLSFGQGRLRFGPWIYNGSADVQHALQQLKRALVKMGYRPNDPDWKG